jgi:hypothetical protein
MSPPRNFSQGKRPFMRLKRKESTPQAKMAKDSPTAIPYQRPNLCLNCRIAGLPAEDVFDEKGFI